MQVVNRIMESCNLSESDARQEFKSASENLLATDDLTLSDFEDFCIGLGIDDEDIFSNPEALLCGLC